MKVFLNFLMVLTLVSCGNDIESEIVDGVPQTSRAMGQVLEGVWKSKCRPAKLVDKNRHDVESEQKVIVFSSKGEITQGVALYRGTLCLEDSKIREKTINRGAYFLGERYEFTDEKKKKDGVWEINFDWKSSTTYHDNGMTHENDVTTLLKHTVVYLSGDELMVGEPQEEAHGLSADKRANDLNKKSVFDRAHGGVSWFN